MSTLFGKKKKRKVREGANHGVHDEANDLLAVPSIDNREDASGDNHTTPTDLPAWSTFEDLGLPDPLVTTCRSLGFTKPTAVQRTVIPFLLQQEASHVLALASTGSGKSAAFILPILARLAEDPYGIFAVILTPTRELAKQIHQQVLALGTAPYRVQSTLVVGGLDMVRQACALDQRPHFCVATPGRLAELLRGPNPPRLKHVRYVVLDEADRLLASNSGFERDVAELLLHCTTTTTKARDGTRATKTVRRVKCQTLLFSATLTRSLESIEEMAGAGLGRLPLKKFVIREDCSDGKGKSKKEGQEEEEDGKSKDEDSNKSAEQKHDDKGASTTPKIPAGLKQEYIFMPNQVRDAYLMTAVRHLIANGGRSGTEEGEDERNYGRRGHRRKKRSATTAGLDAESEANKARSAIIFVATCERAALVSGILNELGVDNVALHSLLTQNRRLAALAKFKSQHVRLLVATDVASRGLDIPTVDLVLNAELPRTAVTYVHRCGRTARAGRRGRAVSLVGENDVALVHAAEEMSGRPMDKCTGVTDDMALKLLGSVTKAARLAKMKLMDVGFDELVKKNKERKARERKERQRIERALRRSSEKS